MATNYPSGLDSLSNPAGSDALSTGHASQHANANDAIKRSRRTRTQPAGGFGHGQGAVRCDWGNRLGDVGADRRQTIVHRHQCVTSFLTSDNRQRGQTGAGFRAPTVGQSTPAASPRPRCTRHQR